METIEKLLFEIISLAWLTDFITGFAATIDVVLEIRLLLISKSCMDSPFWRPFGGLAGERLDSGDSLLLCDGFCSDLIVIVHIVWTWVGGDAIEPVFQPI